MASRELPPDMAERVKEILAELEETESESLEEGELRIEYKSKDPTNPLWYVAYKT
jgi:cyanate lyase